MRTVEALPVAIAVAVLVGALGTAAIAAIAHAAGVAGSFLPLQLGACISLAVFGVVGGGVGWLLVRAMARWPERPPTHRGWEQGRRGWTPIESSGVWPGDVVFDPSGHRSDQFDEDDAALGMIGE
jgi:hypothetical protein